MAKPRKDTTSNEAERKPKPKRARKSRPRECAAAQRSSAYRGVTRHRWTGRFEAHLWDKDACNHEPPSRITKKKKKGRQVYLGAYDDEDAAARAYDMAALKYWGPATVLNFPLSSYGEELKEMEGQSREEYVGSLRRRSSGFSRGVSKYRGVARHHQNGKWEARIGKVAGNKYLYLGTYATQEEAAVAYDIAAIEHRGLNAVTNFDISNYVSRHRRRGLGEGGGLDDDGTETVVPIQQLLNDPIEHAPAGVGFDEESGDPFAPQRREHVRPPAAHAALNLLLRSPKFSEMMEQVSARSSASNNSSSPSSSSSTSPASPPLLLPQRSFPDDVQTHFASDADGMGFAFAEVDTLLFGDLGAYAAPMFHCDLDISSEPDDLLHSW